ncbi:MAG: hypothetical protein IE909_19000 [Campylobacterales bacterium]|nr:hypothetical protein [Campylobacterota bacterium]MBD3843920.1 hypothetical protein [Campylobacterales bacterium]
MKALKQDELFNEIDILPIDFKTEIVEPLANFNLKSSKNSHRFQNVS